ncbi:hypothetical protein [Comamonas sp.]|uniref:hypothetical protein n=1 Tax=Comamonas sp. TaxID=34028 RepID=UPI003A933DCD
MLLQKTAKALEELQPGTRMLPQRARSVLLMAGGKSLVELQQMLGLEHAQLARQLMSEGYLQLQSGTPQPNTGIQTTNPAPSPAAPALPPVAAAAMSMAGTRMYLFDLCERLFANRQEALAQRLRQQLRAARDIVSLREAGLAMLDAVQEHAGEERASALREQLSALLETHADIDADVAA